MIIIGVDPGTRITGFGIIRCNGNNFEVLDYGCIRPPIKEDLNDRYLIIHRGIQELICKYEPTILVVESQFMYKNAQSALKLGMAKLAIILAGKIVGLDVFEYTPKEVKKSVTGRGNASKEQVQGMIQKLFALPELPQPEDAADALALALCHVHKSSILSSSF